MELPKIPNSKLWINNTTKEQRILEKFRDKIPVTDEDIDVLNEALSFYEKAIFALKKVILKNLNNKNIPMLEDYLHNIFNIYLVFQSEFSFSQAFRMVKVQNFNLSENKVRETTFLKNTPLHINKQNGWYGRANTPNSTSLYLAETPQVAVLECKPVKGDRIIISEWVMKNEEPLTMYPINSVQNINETVDQVTNNLDLKLENSNEYFSFVLKKLQTFIGEEFVKDIPIESDSKFEYFYSAYFADKVIKSDYTIATGSNNIIKPKYDGIIYPSISTKYKHINMAIRESSIEKLSPIYCREYLITDTFFDAKDLLEEDLPFEGELLRESIEVDKKIIWNDD